MPHCDRDRRSSEAVADRPRDPFACVWNSADMFYQDLEHAGVSEREESSDPLLRPFLPSERLAIVRYRALLVKDQQRDVSLEETLEVWEDGACGPWRKKKMRLDGQMQLREIERHKYLVSERCGYDIGWDFAAEDWIMAHAGPWRVWWEKQPESSPPP